MEYKRLSFSLVKVIVFFIIIITIIVGLIILRKQKISSDQKNLSNSLSSTNDNSDSTNTNANPEENLTPSIYGISSSKSAPLSVGTWGIASKAESYDNFKDVNVQVSKITRGIDASTILKVWFANSTYYSYSEPDANMEWVVVDYMVDLSNISMSENGNSVKVDSKVIGKNSNNDSIEFNDSIYITSTRDISNTTYTKEDIGYGRFVVQLPIGCTDYLIALGNSSNTIAYFKE